MAHLLTSQVVSSQFAAFPLRPYTPYSMSSHLETTPNSIRKVPIRIASSRKLKRNFQDTQSLGLNVIGLTPRTKPKIVIRKNRVKREKSIFPAAQTKRENLFVQSKRVLLFLK